MKKGINQIKLAVNCPNPDREADILFVVDASGSMSEMIGQLTFSLQDVIRRIGAIRPGWHFRSGAVFYRDHNEPIVVQSQPFSTNPMETLNFLDQHGVAYGGGDFPDAVEAGLEAGICQHDWNPNALARILFLVLDAPAS